MFLLDFEGLKSHEELSSFALALGDVLRRPWCAVEIGTAFLNKARQLDIES